MLQKLQQLKEFFLKRVKALKVRPLLQKLLEPRWRKLWALGLVCVLLLLSALLPKGGERTPAPIPSSEATEPATEPPATEPPAPAAPSGLTPVEGLQVLPEESVSGLCRDGDGAAVMLTRWDDDAQVWRSRLLCLDPETASVTAQVELEPMGDSAAYSLPVLTDTEIRFVDPETERCMAFDRSGCFLGLKDHPVMDREHLGWRNSLIGDDCFSKTNKWAEFSRIDSGVLNRLVAFYDEKDRIRVLAEPYDMIRDVNGHRMLTLRFVEGGPNELALLDVDAKLCVDRLEFDAAENAEGLLGTDWVLLSFSEIGDQDSEHRICFWYPDAAKQSPIEAEQLTEQFLHDGVEYLSRELEKAGIVLHLDEAPSVEQTPTTGLPVYENRCETGASLFGQYWILSQLDEFVQKLPAGMVRELTEGTGGGEEARALHVYLVRKIPGDAAAFANAWMEPTMICFATEEFNPSQLAHEFMHIVDLRLQGYLTTQRQDLESAWLKLSPDYAYESELSQEQSDELENWFVSWYARTDGAEDRAETFMMLFNAEEPLAEQWWYKDKPGVQAKAAWLVENLRAAFPSVQAVEKACWEKLPPEEAPTEQP